MVEMVATVEMAVEMVVVVVVMRIEGHAFDNYNQTTTTTTQP